MSEIEDVDGSTTVIPVMRPLLPRVDELIPYFERIDNSRIYSNYGPIYEELSARLAEYFGVSYDQVLIVANGTLALEGSIRTADTTKNCWVLPSWTFVATGHAVMSAGKELMLGDISESTWALDYSEINPSQNVIYVAPFGMRPEIEGLGEHFTDGIVIIDAASCFDSCRQIGSSIAPNMMLMVSLHATKMVTTGEGGVLIGPADWIRRVRAWSNFGFQGSRIAHVLATNTKISEYHAAIGLASLDNWPRDRNLWNAVTEKTLQMLANWELSAQSALHENLLTSTCIVNFETENERNAAESALNTRGVETRRWWGDGLDQMPAFSSCSKVGNLEITRFIASTTLGVPFYRDLDSHSLEVVSSCFS